MTLLRAAREHPSRRLRSGLALAVVVVAAPLAVVARADNSVVANPGAVRRGVTGGGHSQTGSSKADTGKGSALGDGASAGAVPVARLVAGSNTVTDTDGVVWGADEKVADGGQTWTGATPSAGTRHPELLRSERWAVRGYHLPVPAPGEYRVTLYEAEYYFSSVGQRVFDVTAEGATKLAGADVLAHAARGAVWAPSFTVRVNDGVLDLGFVDHADHARISALAVDRLPNGPAGPADATGPDSGPATPSATPPSQAATSDSPPPQAPTTDAAAPQAATNDTAPLPPLAAQAPPADAAPTNGAPPPPPPANLPPSTGGGSTPEAFGAVGDGHADDTAALQAALDAAVPGHPLVLQAGRTYTHGDVLHVRRPGTQVTGGGTLLATDESKSSVWVETDDVTLRGLTIATASTTHRWEAWEQMGVRLFGHRGAVLDHVTVVGASAAGVYIGNAASHFILDHVTVRDSRADGIHMTGGSHDGRVLSPTIERSGDDGVAVVSYQQDGVVCHDITVSQPMVHGTTGGRGISVVGGRDIHYTDIDVEDSAAAAVYLAAEGNPWFSYAPERVTVTGGRVLRANTDRSIDHGAVLILSGEQGIVPRDVHVSGLTVADTRSSASRSVGVVVYGAQPVDVSLDSLSISGGPSSAYGGNAAPDSYVLRGWTVRGKAVPDHG